MDTSHRFKVSELEDFRLPPQNLKDFHISCIEQSPNGQVLYLGAYQLKNYRASKDCRVFAINAESHRVLRGSL